MTPILVIGIGNPDRGDDGVGPFVAERLERLCLPGLTVLRSAGDPADLLAAWLECRTVVCVDACQSGARSGVVHRFDAIAEPLPADFGALSTHGFGLAAALELARALDALPGSLTVYGIEAASFEPGLPLSPAVREAGEKLAEKIAGALQDDACTKPD